MARRKKPEPKSTAARAVAFLEGLRIPEGPRARQRLKLAPFQTQFIDGALAPQCSMAALSVARGNAKSALAAGVALAALTGVIDQQPRRDIIIAARTRDQARVLWSFGEAFCLGLPDDLRSRLKFRRSPRLEIELEADDGPHLLRAIAADGKSALGSGPTLVICDERAHWQPDKGDELQAALETGCGKRGGRMLLISTSASSDQHTFSRLIDNPPTGCYVQEHRPARDLPADELESLCIANPGAEFGIGASLEWLQASARRAIERGGSSLASFRLYHRNERVNVETRDILISVDQWMACECKVLPLREGPVVVGLDLGGSASMSAAAFYWPNTRRLEVTGCFPSEPALLNRGLGDGVGDRYVRMADRGELFTLGARTVPVEGWIETVWRRIEGATVAAVVADRYKQSEVGEALARLGIAAPVIWRGMGFKDGSEDIERFRRAVFDGQVKTTQSWLMRSAIADTVLLRDPANNSKLAKARSTGRIDPVAAAILAVAEGARMRARPTPKPTRLIWA